VRLIRGSQIFFVEFGCTRRVSRHVACLDFFANLICLLFSIFTNDADKVIFITNNIILPINNFVQTCV
jgi:hypothetical protein